MEPTRPTPGPPSRSTPRRRLAVAWRSPCWRGRLPSRFRWSAVLCPPWKGPLTTHRGDTPMTRPRSPRGTSWGPRASGCVVVIGAVAHQARSAPCGHSYKRGGRTSAATTDSTFSSVSPIRVHPPPRSENRPIGESASSRTPKNPLQPNLLFRKSSEIE